MVNFENLKEQIKNIPPEDLKLHSVIQRAKDGKTYICPICGNGTGETGDGLVVYHNPDGYAYHCYKSGCHFDNISLLALCYNLDIRADFPEILKRAAQDFNLADFELYHNLKQLRALPQKKSIAETNEEIRLKKLTLEIVGKDLAAPDNLELIPDGDRRGIDIETFRFFHCVYNKNWVHPKLRAQGKSIYPTRRILIPSSGGCHYVAVLVNSERTADNKKFWKMHTAGKSSIFGLQTLTADTDYIFVYEGEFNAMTAWQAWKENNFLRQTMNIFGADTAENMTSGEIISADFIPYSAFIATGGAAEEKWIDILAAKCKELGIAPRVVVNFDKDKAGESGAAKVQKFLRGRGYMATINFIEGDD